MLLPTLGIDIAKLKFNVCLLNTLGKLKHKVFANTAVGFAPLVEWLTKQKTSRVHACMEATGAYGEALALHLHVAGHTVSVINPAAIKSFAGSRLSRTKPDKVDVELIARFCAAQQPLPWTPPAPEVRELQAHVRRLEARTEMRVGEANRLEATITVESVRASVEEPIGYLRQTNRADKSGHPPARQRASQVAATKRVARLPSGHRRDDRRRTPRRDHRHHTIPKCPASSGLCRLGATRETLR